MTGQGAGADTAGERRILAIAEMLDECREYYDRPALSDRVMGLYTTALSSYSLEAIRHALDVHMHDPDAGRWFPRVSDLERHMSGSRSDRATIAWSKLLSAIRHVGPWPSIAFDDLRIHAVVHDMGGWPVVCRWTDEELPYRERDFLRAYSAALRATHPVARPYLAGEAEKRNPGQRSMLPCAMRYVGNPERARAIAMGREVDGEPAALPLPRDTSARQPSLARLADQPVKGKPLLENRNTGGATRRARKKRSKSAGKKKNENQNENGFEDEPDCVLRQ